MHRRRAAGCQQRVFAGDPAALGNGRVETLSLNLQNGTARGGWRVGRCNSSTAYTVNVAPDGHWTVLFESYGQDCQRQSNTFAGTVQGGTLQFRWSGGQNTFTLSK